MNCFSPRRLERLPLGVGNWELGIVEKDAAATPGCRIYEVDISHFGRTYEEGKKITRIPHLQATSKMSPEQPTESSPLDDFSSEIAPN